MSPESDLLFTPADSILFPEFSNLTEFQELPKDIYLSNGMDNGEDLVIDGVVGARGSTSFPKELHCKADLKPLLSTITEINEDFDSPLKNGNVNDCNSQHGVGVDALLEKPDENPFNIFLEQDPASSFDDITSMPTDYIETIESLSESISISTSFMAPDQSELLSPRTLQTAAKLNCMSLMDGLDVKHLNTAHAFTSNSRTIQPVQCVTNSSATLPPLSPLGKPPTRTLSLSEAISSSIFQINSPPPSVQSTTSAQTIRNNNSPTYMIFGNDEMSSIVKQQSISSDLNKYTDSCSSTTIQSPKGDGLMAAAVSPDNMQFLSSNSTLQRSHSSHALGQLRTCASLDSCIETFHVKPEPNMEMMFPNTTNASNFAPYQTQEFGPRSTIAPMRRVYSTGDLQTGVQNLYGSNMENNKMEEGMGIKIGHCTVEERKMKLNRYRQKRHERNFNKKIKYACRKTLADSRPRIRGRFARTDDSDEVVTRNNDISYSNDHSECHYARTMPEATSFVVKRSCTMDNKQATKLWRNVEMNVAI